jgi:hypothetical protein
LLAIALVIVVPNAHALDDAVEIPEFDRIRTPDSPAFVILGVSPTEIQRPTTPRQLVASLGTLVTKEDDLLVPTNLSVEFAPYWIGAHDNLTFDTYEANRGKWYRDLTMSVATDTRTETFLDAADIPVQQSVTGLGLGLRTRLIAGRVPDVARETRARVERRAQAVAVRIGLAVDTLVAPMIDSLVTLHQDPDDLNRALEDLVEEKKAELMQAEPVRSQIEALQLAAREAAAILAARNGWVADLAIAASWAFADATWDTGTWRQARAWAAVAYAKSAASLVFAARGGVEDRNGSDDWSVDGGTRAVLARSAYAASAEFMYRRIVSGGPDPNRVRVAVALDYMITDGSWLAISFGKDFASDESGSLFTIANLKWGIGKPKVSLP